MSLPSDVTSDIPPASEARAPHSPRGTSRMTREEQGWVVAALVAFLGIAYLGPAIARYRRTPSLKERLARRLQDSERRARDLARRGRKRARRLGGGSIWR